MGRPHGFGGFLQAVILVGGEGTRLRPLTYGTPKPMVPLFGVPFLERTLSRLRGAGIDDVILAAGYLPKAIADHLGDGSRLGMKLTYIIEDAPLGTAGAIRNVEQHLKGPFFVLNGDVLTSLDLARMLAYHKEKNGLGVIHLIRVEDPSPFGCVVHDANGLVTSFVEKPQKDQAPTDEINAGTYLLEPGVLQVIPHGRNVSIERETFPMLLAGGAPLYAYTTDDYWLDLGRPDQYLQAHADVLDGKLELGPTADPEAHQGTFWRVGDSNIPPNVRPPAFFGADVVLEREAIAGPYTVLGNGTHLGAGAEVSGSILWDGVSLGARARVTDSILASNVHVGGAASIGSGSVIGHDAQIEAGAEIAPHSRISAEAPAQA
jgi:mannose-1-phosphate guanylyltransferase